MSMSYVDATRLIIDDQLNQAEERLHETMRVAPALIRRAVQTWVNHQAGGLGRLVPNGLAEEVSNVIISAALDALEQCLHTVAILRVCNEYLGSPARLRAIASSFGDISESAENLQIKKDDLDGLMSWDHQPASRTYDYSIDDQVRAVGLIPEKLSGIAGVLRTHADDIESFYLNLAGLVAGTVITVSGVISAILSLAGAIVTSPTGVGFVLGIIATALSTLIAVAGTGMAGISALQLLLSAIQGTSNKLDALLSSMPKWEAPRFAIIQ